MGRRSVQLNIRATEDVAEAFRQEAQKRNLSLGDTLAALLTLARARRTNSVTVELPSDGDTALRAVAAARGQTPGEVLARLVEGELRRELLEIAARLSAEGAANARGLRIPEPEEDEVADEDEVGVFTVFD